MPSKKRFFGGLVGANPLRSGSFQDPGSVARTSSNEGVVSIDSAGPETSTTTVVVLNDYSSKTETQFNASNAGANDEFGTNCALSGDGTIAVFGAPDEDGASNTLSNYGAAYVYENGTEVAILRASDQSSRFGWDVAISKDGSLIVVASPFAPNGSYTNSGKLYIFEKPAGGWGSATTEDYQISTNNTEAYLGRHVRLTDNGDTIIATATLSSQERVLVYNRGSAWSDRTGHNAQLSASNWSSNDGFGYGLAISGDGSVIAVGAPDEDTTQAGSGSVYIYHKPTNGWATATETHFIGSFNRTFNALFGRSCSLNEDGTILAIGEFNYGNSAGRIHVREYNGSTWSHSGVLTGAGSNDYLGDSVCISRDGNTIAGGAPRDDLGKGALHIYFKPSSGWGNASHNYKLTTTNVTNDAYLGGSVNYPFTQPLALSNDGRKVLSAANEDDDGATNSGSGFLFTATGGTASTTTTTTQTTQWFWGGMRGRDAIVEGAGEAGDDKSLRLDGTGDYLITDAVSASNRKTFTTSAWIKLDKSPTTADAAILASSYIGGTYNYQVGFAVATTDDLFWFDYSNSWVALYQTQNTLNIGSWYHVVCQVDTTATPKCKIWIDGTLQTLQTVTYDYSANSDTLMSVGTWPSTSVGQKFTVGGMYSEGNNTLYYDFPGQLAEVHFIDGTAYDASYFGETRDGVWVPKEVTGLTYGNNGFYLDFKGNDTGVTLLLDGSSLTDDLSNAQNDVSNAGNVSIPSTQITGPYGVAQDTLYFNGTTNGHLVGTAGDLTDLGDGDPWTMECWVKLGGTSTQQGVFGVNASTTPGALPPNNRGITLRWGGTNGNWEWWTNGYTVVSSASGTATTNWQHVALVYDGAGSSTLFINGASVGTRSSVTTLDATDKVVLGRNYSMYDEGDLDGYIADFRITKGYARYTNSFTPPTSALSADVSGITGSDDVTLLLDGSSTTDASNAGNNFSLYGINAAANNTGVSDPYGGSKGSFIFDGSGDALTSTNGDIIGIANPFTVEFWVRHDTLSLQNYLDISGSNSGWTSGGNLLSLLVTATQMQLQWWDGSSGNYTILQNHGMSVDRWHHVALVYDGTGMTLYVDGSSIGSLAGTTTDGNATHTYFGLYRDLSSYPFDGRMHDIRITKGAALYPFHPPISALTNTPEYLGDFGVDRSTDGTGVTLLLDGSGGGTATITDNSSAGNDMTNVSTGVSNSNITGPYGTTQDVLDFDGSNDYLEDTITGSNGLLLGTDDFTFETWVKLDSTAIAWGRIFEIGEYSSSGGFRVTLNGTTGQLYMRTSSVTGTSSTVLNTTDWYHIAATRSGDTFTLFINGSQEIQFTDSGYSIGATSGTHSIFRIGSGQTGTGSTTPANYIDGKITDFRITRGVARYSGSFTPPTSALTNDDTWDKPKNDFSVEGNITADDQLIDTPNLRFATLDPDFSGGGSGQTLSEGNLKYYCPVNTEGYFAATEGKTSGKWYFEMLYDGSTNNTGHGIVGWTYDDISQSTASTTINPLDLDYGGMIQYSRDQIPDPVAVTIDADASVTFTSPSTAPNDIFGVAFDADTQTIWFSVNNTWFSGDPGTGQSPSYNTLTSLTSGKTYIPFIGHFSNNASRKSQAILNFGQDHTFAGEKPALLTPYSDANGVGEFYYQPPSGFLALADSYVVTDALATTGVLSTSEMLQASL